MSVYEQAIAAGRQAALDYDNERARQGRLVRPAECGTAAVKAALPVLLDPLRAEVNKMLYDAIRDHATDPGTRMHSNARINQANAVLELLDQMEES